MNRYEDEARREIEHKETFRRWVQSRVETVHDRISASDVLSRYHVKLRYGGQRQEQMFCPFHGNKRTPAATYHPKEARSHDAVWCYVCNERWDCIALFRKFENLGSEAKFTAVLHRLERAYGIIPPEAPPVLDDEPDDTERQEIDEAFATADRMLRNAQKAFECRGYLTLGSALDRLSWQYENGRLQAPTVLERLRMVREKIVAKERAYAPTIEGLDP